MITLTTENCLLFGGGFFFLIWGAALLFFSRISIRHIEGEMAKIGKQLPEWDNGIGARFSSYSLVILFPNIRRHASLIDVESTLLFKRRIDWYLAFFANVSFLAFFITACVRYYLYSPSN